MSEFDFAVVIATRNRPLHLERLVHKILEMEPSPKIIVVADSSDDQILRSNKAKCEIIQHSSIVKLVHISSKVQSLTYQKNIAIDYLLSRGDCFAVQILDDDTLPSGDFFSKQLNFLVENGDAIGVSGLTSAPDGVPQLSHPRWMGPLLKIFGLLATQGGTISPAGTGIPVSSAFKDPVHVDWLIGCSMWKLLIFKEVKYRDSLKGSCLFEDVDFSQRAARHGSLFVLPNVYLEHLEAPEERPTSEIFAYRFNRNRYFVINNMQNTVKPKLYFFMSSMAISAFYLAKFFLNAKPSRGHWKKMYSNSVAGTLDACRNKDPI